MLVDGYGASLSDGCQVAVAAAARIPGRSLSSWQMTSPHGQSWWAWPVLKYNLRSFLPNRNSWSCFDYIYAWLDSWPPGQASSWPEGGGGCEWTPALPRGPWYASGGAQNRYGHYPNPTYRIFCSIFYCSVFKIKWKAQFIAYRSETLDLEVEGTAEKYIWRKHLNLICDPKIY